MNKRIIATERAPQAIGAYSQAVQIGQMVYLSGQIGLDPASMTLVEGFEAQARRVFDNLRAVCAAAGGGLDDIVKLTVYLTDLSNFNIVNEVMAENFRRPYPARATLGVSALPRGGQIEVDAILVVPSASYSLDDTGVRVEA
jgi:reactive intermediate/imine deaminase